MSHYFVQLNFHPCSVNLEDPIEMAVELPPTSKQYVLKLITLVTMLFHAANKFQVRAKS
jgi:hypothetical protein